jgi:adenosylcobyric acid synthase
MIVLPGSKATIADMAAMRSEGWDIDVRAHHRRGGVVLGLCGGYQMLGRGIADPHGIEGPAGSIDGLGLLDVDTVLAPQKSLRRVTGSALGASLEGYEMHMGETTGPDAARPFALLDGGRPDGAISADGRVMGSYVHGLLADAALRSALLATIGLTGGGRDYHATVDAALDEIAAALEEQLDIDALIALAGTTSQSPA